MSYNPTQWKDGDLVTSAKLNKLEQGVAAGGIQVIHAVSSNDSDPVLDKTWQEIYDGGFGVVVYEYDGKISYAQIMGIGQMDPLTYVVVTQTLNQFGLIQFQYIASSPDDYPVQSSGSSNGGSSGDNGTTVK